MRTGQSATDIFGPGATDFLAVPMGILSEVSAARVSYDFLSPDRFNNLLESNWPSAQQVYWSELIGRTHLTAVSSLLRSNQWINGALVAYENNLFLPFCANIRALIEATGDSITGLASIAPTLAGNAREINAALRGEAASALLCGELEDQLIHFTHGRRVEKNEIAPGTHSARSAKSYVERLDDLGLKNSYALYSTLCQVTHPASQSVTHFLVTESDSRFALFPHNDLSAIHKLVDDHQSFFRSILMYAFNPAVILLRVLCHLELSQFRSRVVSQLNLSRMPGWVRCASLMGVSP